MIKGVIFDFYETLIEADIKAPSAWECLNQMGYNSSLSLQSQWESDAFDGQLTPSLNDYPSYHDWLLNNFKEFAKSSGVHPNSIDDIARTLLENDRNWTFKAKPYARELINYCHNKGLRIGVCSNWDYPLEHYLEQTNLSTIEHWSVSCEVGARKPHPLIFNDILKKTELFAHEALFIGDTWKADIIGSTNAGMKAIWLKASEQTYAQNASIALHMKTLMEVFDYVKTEL